MFKGKKRGVVDSLPKTQWIKEIYKIFVNFCKLHYSIGFYRTKTLTFFGCTRKFLSPKPFGRNSFGGKKTNFSNVLNLLFQLSSDRQK